ncbi:DeoR/GlpR family DNA-binding transcription regulator [uncultured Jatrophihabitans sp.]|uniref:DeoR/GlpR family DNA-binding transcription regulator n=1 Tax=uncultured Jatrophihabitans sp. TaxID=1610747 RepID=UPI0035CC0F52
MLVPDRHRALLDVLRRSGSAQVEHLAHSVGVSASTVRRDLAVLESEGLLRRARGGAYVAPAAAAVAPVAPAAAVAAVAPSTLSSILPSSGGHEVKARLGRRAAEFVEDGMTVLILGGSSTEAMLPYLTGRTLSVVTNGLDVATALAPHPQITLVLLGGVLHRQQMTLLGPMTAQNMADLHVDVLFAGAYGIHPDIGVTGVKVTQAGYHHSMLRHTESLVVLATGEKFGRQGPTLLARTEQVNTFITDDTAPQDVLDAVRAQGPAVIVC